MSDKNVKTKKVASGKSKSLKNKDKKPNAVLWIGLVVILIPCLILLYIILGTKEKAGEPVVGDRFETQLNPAISEQQLNEVKSALTYSNAENVEVNLISATLRITINASDDISYDDAVALMDDAYDKTIGVIPVDPYFTNVKGSDDKVKTKMYDIEVQVYNVLKDQNPNNIDLIYLVKAKSAGSSDAQFNVFSKPKNSDVADGLLNPKAPEVPTQEE